MTGDIRDDESVNAKLIQKVAPRRSRERSILRLRQHNGIRNKKCGVMFQLNSCVGRPENIFQPAETKIQGWDVVWRWIIAD